MARLIDAEALKEKKVYSYERHEKIVPVAEIDWMPTIDAIPVEWLGSKMLDLQNKDKALSRAAWLVLYEWQKEAQKLGIQPKEG